MILIKWQRGDYEAAFFLIHVYNFLVNTLEGQTLFVLNCCLQQSARFLSDIGGIMGMWIGISALTCVEALELMASLCSMILRKVKQKRTDVIEVQPNDNSA